MEQLSFCILKTPFPLDDKDYTIFITRSGYNHFDYTIKKEKSYTLVKKELKKMGYLEMDDLRFQQASKNKKFLSKTDIIALLRSLGLKYSKKFEDSISEELSQIEKMINPKNVLNIFEEFVGKDEVDRFEYSKHISITDGEKNIVPGFGDTIKLSLYMTFDFEYDAVSKDFIIDLNGTFLNESNRNKKYRNIVMIITEEFERIPIENSFEDVGRLCFVSKKSKGELIKGVSFLYEVIVDLMKLQKTAINNARFDKDEHSFDIFEIREKIRRDDRMVITVDCADYKQMIELSDRIQVRSSIDATKPINYDDVVRATDDLLEDLNNKMLQFAGEEEYWKASEIKGDMKKIRDKMSVFGKKNQKTINIEEFHRYFNLK